MRWGQLVQKGATTAIGFGIGILVMAVLSHYQGLIEVQVSKEKSYMKIDGTSCKPINEVNLE
jgi:hypothetical protein